ncbi:MAG: thioredoxin fold domain-containing protein [Gammaproteobacteria bacterium]|nr:thioredoxin fold domain-containing protein [Gammaproteobacteria bacterium]
MSKKAVKKAPPRKRQSRRAPILIGGAVVAAIALVAFLTTGSETEGENIKQTRPVTITGQALPPYEHDTADPAIGMTAPEINGATFDGTPLSITNDGTPKAIIMLAHWCPHCQTEVEELTPWIAEHGVPEGGAIVSISTSANVSQPNYPPSKWLADWPVPTIADDSNSSSARAFGLTGFPFIIFVDADGTVVGRVEGGVAPEMLYQFLEQMAGQ